MRTALSALLVIGVAVNAALFAWQLRAPPKTTMTVSADNRVVMRTPGGLLEVSMITAEERFDSTTSHTILGVPVGSTVAQVRVPAVYRYHIPLAKDWTLRSTGNALVVIAPPVRPSLPVAIDTAKLESFASGLWSPLTGADAVASLQRSITATLAKKSAAPDMIKLQREAARQTVTEFVQKWVVQQPKWKGAKAPAILVFFEDEPLGQRAAPLMAESP
ncbi:hypothetical protein [Ramlibacter sp.]|uniref:hypothetical protein n=1 Tax=Ramlibacter sp. TaxID=1917967 RepID=UPI0017E2BF04|nr:hypothetical protein [Ramlibacter sp.]MBA2675274.1 hypothetical protein [Ramlibacter sp.]